VLAAVVSDLHLGIHSGADLLRRPDVQARLFEALSGADEVVLLGDAIELRDGSLAESLERALPFFEAFGAALGSRRLTIVPGNHDHRFAEDALRRARHLGLEQRFEVRPGDALELVVRSMGGSRVVLAYPGVWVRDDVYATHGHYLDCHSEVPTFECRARAVVERVRRLDRDSYHSPADYERALAPIYRLIHWGVQPAAVRAAAHAGRRLVRRWERPRAELGARIRFGVPAMEQVVHNLRIDARHVLFGHLHGPGRWKTESGVELVNTGCWVQDPVSVSPGTCVLVPNQGPPRLQSVL
jgi:UDP-2,3-diacylglucosamine pyrophosphatase LpxH